MKAMFLPFADLFITFAEEVERNWSTSLERIEMKKPRKPGQVGETQTTCGGARWNFLREAPLNCHTLLLIEPGLEKQARSHAIHFATHLALRKALLAQDAFSLARREALVYKLQR